MRARSLVIFIHYCLDVHISEPSKSQKTVSVQFNKDSLKYEGLPTAWRELLNMEP